MDLSEDLGSSKKRRNNIWRAYWRSGAKLTFPEHPLCAKYCAKCAGLSNWISVARQIYDLGYYTHFTDEQTEAWWANLPRVTLVSGRARFIPGGPQLLNKKKTHSNLARAAPSFIFHILLSPGTHLTPSSVLHGPVSGELRQKTEFLVLKMTSRSLCSIYDLLVFSIFKMNIVNPAYDLNAKFSGNVRISIEAPEQSGWREGKRDWEFSWNLL